MWFNLIKMKNLELNQEAFDQLFKARISQNEQSELEAVAEFENEPVIYQEKPTKTTILYKVLW